MKRRGSRLNKFFTDLELRPKDPSNRQTKILYLKSVRACRDRAPKIAHQHHTIPRYQCRTWTTCIIRWFVVTTKSWWMHNQWCTTVVGVRPTRLISGPFSCVTKKSSIVLLRYKACEFSRKSKQACVWEMWSVLPSLFQLAMVRFPHTMVP